MLDSIKHAYRVIHSQVREHVVKGIVHGITGKRSPHWPALRKQFLVTHPTCAACGGSRLLNVHHKMPFHDRPELELDPHNLITLCMGRYECHLLIGHGDDFKAYNPLVEQHAALVKADPSKREATQAEAKSRRLYE